MGVGSNYNDLQQCPIRIKIVSFLTTIRECQFVEMDMGWKKETDGEKGRIISVRKATPHERMKKSIELTEEQRAMLKGLEEMPDEHIDTSDIPEIRDSSGWFATSQIPVVIKKLRELNVSRRNNGRQKGAKSITREDALRIQNEIVEADGCNARGKPLPQERKGVLQKGG